MVMEFWTGWFDWWGVAHHTMSLNDYARELESILSVGASVNFYMFFGGTNFGFMNGGFLDGKIYRSDITSYDYDAIISENGDLTKKYFLTKRLISKFYPQYLGGKNYTSVQDTKRAVYNSIATMDSISLWQAIEGIQPLHSEMVLPMEFLLSSHNVVQSYGYILYSADVKNQGESSLVIRGLQHAHDRGVLFINKEKKAILDANLNQQNVKVGIPKSMTKISLEILVENGGRTNWANFNDQRKGLVGEVSTEGHDITNWKMYCLDMKPDFIEQLSNSQNWNKDIPNCELSVPTFYKFVLQLQENPDDTYLDMRQWGKGVVFVNSQNVGRYWSIGPQQTLYLPAPWLNIGKNTITVFEEQKCANYISFVSDPILDKVG